MTQLTDTSQQLPNVLTMLNRKTEIVKLKWRIKMNLAALSALARGDVDNFQVAATPGGIEAQEAAGQAMMVASESIPKEIHGATREQLEAIGFVFGKDVDTLFVTCKLPAGWTKRATGHSMHSDIFDEQGRCRACIFYKAAFYDRRADMTMKTRYSLCSYVGEPDGDKYAVEVQDGGKCLKSFGDFTRGDYKAAEPMEKAAKEWMYSQFPDCESPLAYW